jgi:transposase-like protein
MTYDLTNPIYNDEEAARKHFEAIRWPNGPVCPHCGVIGNAVELQGKSTRPGVYKCRECRKPFTATIGTIYERSHIPMHKWLLATHLLCSSKKGISAHQLFRMLGFGSYRTAWFMAHRIRETMKEISPPPIGGSGKTVEADETYIGRKEGRKKAKAGYGHKRVVLSLVERGGKARSFHLENARVEDVVPIVRENIPRESHLMTDESRLYRKVGTEFTSHDAIEHGKDEYVRGLVHTNTIEGYFSIFKRGMTGVYQHCGENHLHRYLTEFDFRYNNRSKLGCNDAARAELALKGAEGKRLLYRGPRQEAA